MRSQEVKDFIRKNSHLFWYTPENKKEDISDEFLVETILNYGTMETVKELFSILGIQNVADIFNHTIRLSERRKGNYNELTLNYFTLLFDKYAQRNIQ